MRYFVSHPRIFVRAPVFLLLLFLSACSHGAARVDGSVASIRDGIAILDDLFGNTMLRLYLYDRKLSQEDKKKLLSVPKYAMWDTASLEGINRSPVLELWLIFEEGAKTCAVSSLKSYTAIFRRTSTFPFDVPMDAPINWAFSPGRDAFSRLECQLQAGSKVDLSLKGSWNATAENFHEHMPPGKNSVLFTWNVDMKTEIFPPRK